MTHTQYLQKFVGHAGWLSQNPHGWFEFTLAIHPKTRHDPESRGRVFEAEHILTEVHDDFVVVTNKPIATYSRLIPISLFILQYIEEDK